MTQNVPLITTTLGSLIDSGDAELQTGPFGTMLNASEYVPTGTPVVAVQNIGENRFIESDFVYVDDSTSERLAKYRLLEGDIIFGRKGAVDRRVLIRKNEVGWIQGSDCIRLRLSQKIDAEFLSYQLGNPFIKQWITANANGATMPSLNQEILSRLPLSLPPLPIQRRIADILSAYDDLIENNQRQIKLLEEAAMRLYREWFVFMRFPGHESVRIVDGVPEGWQEATIGEMAEYLNGFAFKPSDWKEEGYPIIKIKELTEGVTSDTPKNSGESIPEKYLVKKGDIIFSWSATLFVKIWDLEDGLLNQHLFKVTPLQNVCREFVLQSIQGALPEFYNLTTGSTMVHIQRDKLDRVKRLIPDKEIMRQYEETSVPIREKILSLTSQIYSLQKARDALLPRLMNGGEGLKLEGGAV